MSHELLLRMMTRQGAQQIMQCQDFGGIAPAYTRSDGTAQIQTDISLGGCESHEFVALNGELEGTPDDSVMLDTIFDLFTEKHRQYVLYYLDSQDGPVSVEDVSNHVARWEVEGPPETIPSDISDRIEVTLTHQHLSKLDSVEYIEYDRDTQRIPLRGASPAFEAIITIAKLVEKPGKDGC